MYRQLITAAAFACIAATSRAHPIEFTFSYQGFFFKEIDRFDPTALIAGRFTADDLNGNGVFERHELLSFFHTEMNDYLTCGVGDQYFWLCEIKSFSYKPGGLVNFHTTWDSLDSAYQVHSSTITGKEYALTYRSQWMGDYDRTFVWTDQTVFNITPAPVAVPEPLSASLVALGLMGIVAARLRARRRPRQLRS